MSLSGSSKSAMDFAQDVEDTDYIKVPGSFNEIIHGYFPYRSNHSVGDAFQSLSKSDYAKVIFCDLYYNTDSTVGCRFQITDNVHEDPCDYIGLFRVGYDNLSQCLASKMLSKTECEDDGKLLRCTFKPTELPELENGFYQFLYVTRDKEVCGASMPFEIKNTIPKDVSSDEDIVADKTEDDFLVVRSNVSEKNRRLQLLLDEMNEKCLTHESEMRKIHEKFRIINEEKITLEQLLKKACDEKIKLFDENQRIREERNVICGEKEEAIRILKEKNAVLSSMFDDFSYKLKGFTELKDALEADKDLAIAENIKLQDRIKKLTEEIQIKQNILEQEKEKMQEMAANLRKENSIMNSQLDDARLMIEALEKSKQLSMDDLSCLSSTISELKQKFKDMKCENLALKMHLKDSQAANKESDGKIHNMKSEITALKLHILEMGFITEEELCKSKADKSNQKKALAAPNENVPIIVEEKCTSAVKEPVVIQESTQTSAQANEELHNLKIQCEELQSQLEEKDGTMLKLKEEIVKSNAVVEYLTKERDSVQRNGSRMQDALNECVLRLNEASELYKKQYRKIEKLKKKLKNDKDDHSSEISSVNDLCSAADNADETSSGLHLPQNHNSDSDTGEHVVGHPLKDEIQKNAMLHGASNSSQFSQLPTSAKDEPSSKSREVPELQTMIEMNLEHLSNCKSKRDDEILYAIPCPICDQDVGVYTSSTDEMVKHLEVQHKQQLCPVCGRLFDMTLPSKYFQFHVEDHFKKGNK